jgi:hypothetical protein
MADLTDIQDQIRSMAANPKNVEAKAIVKILDVLRDKHGFDTGARDTGHGLSCWIGDQTFSRWHA